MTPAPDFVAKADAYVAAIGSASEQIADLIARFERRQDARDEAILILADLAEAAGTCPREGPVAEALKFVREHREQRRTEGGSAHG